MLVGLTNVPEKEDWDVIIRLFKILSPAVIKRTKNKINRLLSKREPYVIPSLLSMLTLDDDEYTHLMTCIAQNGLEDYRAGGTHNEEVYEAAEYYKLG